MERTDNATAGEPKYDVVWPLSRKVVPGLTAAPRLADLNGKTVGELWDWNFRGETIYPLVREYIKTRFPDVRFVDYSEFENFHGPGADSAASRLPAKLREHGCDAVIVGIGA